MARALYRFAEGALMPGARAGLAARLYLGALRQVAAEPADVFVVNVLHAVNAKSAYLAARHISVATSTRPAERGTPAATAAARSTAASSSTIGRARPTVAATAKAGAARTLRGSLETLATLRGLALKALSLRSLPLRRTLKALSLLRGGSTLAGLRRRRVSTVVYIICLIGHFSVLLVKLICIQPV